jgi:AraC-like DNA-binding protein
MPARNIDELTRHYLDDTRVRVPVSLVWRLDADPLADPQTQRLVDAGVIDVPGPGLLQYNYAPLGGSGVYRQVVLSDELVVGLANLVFPREMRQHYWADEPLLMLRASLAADCAYTVPGLPTMAFTRPEIVLAYVPQGAEIHVDVRAGARQHSVLLLMNATRFLDRFELTPEALPPVLAEVLAGQGRAGRLLTLPLDSTMGALVEAMTRPMRSAPLQRLATRGALSELIAWILDAAERNPVFAGPGGLRHRDLHLAHAVRDRLDRQAAAPPRFAELAREVGSNAKTLKQVFKRVFGTTMADYCVEKRMRMAQSLLLEGRLSVGQVAERVGYEHQSSFTSAFRSHTGMTPREYRQHRAALDISLAPPPRKPRAGRSA